MAKTNMPKKIKKTEVSANLDANCRLRQLCSSKTYMSFVASPKFLLCCTLSCNLVAVLNVVYG